MRDILTLNGFIHTFYIIKTKLTNLEVIKEEYVYFAT